MPNTSASESMLTPIPALPAGKVWIVPPRIEPPQSIVDIALGSPVIAALLMKRGVKSAEDARKFLDESTYQPTSASTLPDIDKAVARIRKAIDEQQQITIYGDYDVDGVTGTSVLLTVLRQLGAKVEYYIPNRVTEGYGLNLKAISILASKKKTRLIITCDCGVSNFAEINFARSLSVETVVLDHHTMPEVLPPAAAIVHPKLLDSEHPLYHLPGVGVAYKVAEELLRLASMPEKADELLDFVTLGMIADLVPLIRENRYLVKIGLEKLVTTKRVGLKQLLAQVNGQNDTDLVGFGIAPRINAAGRLSDANKAVELLTTDDVELATEIAKDLQTENVRRQELCEKIFLEADARVQRQVSGNWNDAKCIAIYDREWHHGVVGIVASRLVEKYHRPVFIGQLDAEEGVVRGSARGIEQIDLYEVLKANEHLLSRWGGHKMAAGFSVEYGKADELCRALVATCNRMLAGQSMTGVVEVDLEVLPQTVDLNLARQLRVLAPFGMSNRKPRFCMKGLVSKDVRVLGKDGKHHRIMLTSDDGQEFECVMWNSQGRVPLAGRPVDLVFTADVNVFNGRERLQLVINDWRDLYVGDEITSLEQVAEMQRQKAAIDAKSSTEYGGAGSAAPAAALAENVIDTLARVVDGIALPTRDPISPVVKYTWRDLRANDNPEDLLRRGKTKLGKDMVVFAEACPAQDGFIDRTGLVNAQHLMLWQYPPSKEIFQQILTVIGCEQVYLVGADKSEIDEPSAFLKRLYGLVRYAVNQKEGRVESEKLEALMATSTMGLALGLTVLKQVHLIDWMSEDSVIQLDCLGNAGAAFDECVEFQQLASTLDEIKAFRRWCSTTPVKDIQLGLIQHGVPMVRETAPEAPMGSEEQTEDDYDNSDGQTTDYGLPTSS
ncbi:MAG: single-stranded-DNA-specific exonuclease RecJ [Candidatus Obscuribacterales bacterium]|nr:single-stranded-DNA-specific exonuclease RecJ [Candidatus Obscuribacterales bacterium]